MKPKTTQGKAQLMYAEGPESLDTYHNMLTLWVPGAVAKTHWCQPVAVIPTDAKSYQQIVERMARAMLREERTGETWGEYRRLHPNRYQAAIDDARAALRSIGIAAPSQPKEPK